MLGIPMIPAALLLLATDPIISLEAKRKLRQGNSLLAQAARS
jgi:hypothetical protein